MTEEELLAAILELAAVRGWRVFHARPARLRRKGVDVYRTWQQGHAGFPDLVMLRASPVTGDSEGKAWELKASGKDPSDDQWDWLNLWDPMSDWDVRIIRPDDWASGRVESWLR